MEVNTNFSPRAQEDYGLVLSAISGNDQIAYTKLMERYKNSVYFMILKMVNNKDDAEDLTIEAFGKAFKNIDKYSPDFAFSTWLFKIATNNTIDFIRKNRLQTTPIEGGEYDDSAKTKVLNIACSNQDPEENYIKEQRKEIMQEIVQNLSPKYKKLVEMRYFQELSYEEISQELDLPLGTVKAQLFRAKNLLFKVFDHRREVI